MLSAREPARRRSRPAGEVVQRAEDPRPLPKATCRSEGDVQRMSPVDIRGCAVATETPEGAVQGPGRAKVDRIARRYLEAGRLPPSHPGLDLVDRVPPQGRRDGRDLLEALPAVELGR